MNKRFCIFAPQNFKTKMAKIGYARVSKKEQNVELQLDALTKYGCDKIYQEKKSAVKIKPILDKVLENLQENDTLVIWKIDRLGRTNFGLVTLFEDLRGRNIRIISLSDCLDTLSAIGKLHCGLLSVYAEFERDIIIERTIAGLQSTRDRGVILGRPIGLSLNSIEKANKCATLYCAGRKTKSICEEVEVSRATLYKYLKFKKIKLRKRNI